VVTTAICCFYLQKRSQLFIGTRNETLSLAAIPRQQSGLSCARATWRFTFLLFGSTTKDPCAFLWSQLPQLTQASRL